MPGTLNLSGDLAIRHGDTWGPVAITLPDLTSLGAAQAGLAGAVITAAMRFGDTAHELDVAVVDETTRQVELSMTATASAALPPGNARGSWDFTVAIGAWRRTLLEGYVSISPDIA